MQQQLMRSVVSLPGGGYAALPFWPQALEALQQKAGGRLLSAALAASRGAGAGQAGRARAACTRARLKAG